MKATREIAVRLDHICKQFHGRKRTITALDNICLEVRQNSRLGIVGESGSGKSTLARLITGLDFPTSGTLEIDGRPISRKAIASDIEFRHRCQMVFQNPYDAVNPRLRVRDIVGEPIERLKLATEERNRRLSDALNLVDLTPAERYLDRRPHELSGGQLQRIVMARALVPRPTLVVGDEPVSMLDVSARARILNVFKNLAPGITCILISHDLALVGYVCDQVAVMYRGRIVEMGPTPQILQDPRHPYTAALIAATPSPRPDQPRSPLPITGDKATDQPNKGCNFSSRCPYAKSHCEDIAPDLTHEDHRRFACHYPLPTHHSVFA